MEKISPNFLLRTWILVAFTACSPKPDFAQMKLTRDDVSTILSFLEQTSPSTNFHILHNESLSSSSCIIKVWRHHVDRIVGSEEIMNFEERGGSVFVYRQLPEASVQNGLNYLYFNPGVASWELLIRKRGDRLKVDHVQQLMVSDTTEVVDDIFD